MRKVAREVRRISRAFMKVPQARLTLNVPLIAVVVLTISIAEVAQVEARPGQEALKETGLVLHPPEPGAFVLVHIVDIFAST